MIKRQTFITGLSILVSAVMLVIFVATIFSAFGGYADPRRWVLPAIACMAFPWLFPTTVVLTALSLLFSRRMAVAGFVTIAICLIPVFSIAPIHFSSAPDHRSLSGTDTFSVMTFNAYYFNSFVSVDDDDKAADASSIAILEADPSVVVFQESTPYDPFELGRRKVSNSIGAAIRARYPYRYFAPFAMGIISKYPFRRVAVPYDRFDPSFMVARYDVEVGDSLVHILNVHLQSLMISRQDLAKGLNPRRLLTSPRAIMNVRRTIMPRIASAFRKRAYQATIVRNILDDMPKGPTIVCGDFNDVPDCYAIHVIEGDDLTDCYTASAIGPTYTYRSHHLYFRIDQMLCNRDLKPLYMRRVSAGGSDHFPLIAYFAFR